MKPTIVLALSGGLDSTVLLAHYLAMNNKIHCCIFNYNSKHNKYENAAAYNVISYYNKHLQNDQISHEYIDLSNVFTNFKSNLLKSGDDIPDGDYERSSLIKTVVPGRNLIMASIMAGIAESNSAVGIALGVHSGDHELYPDCRPAFIIDLRQTIYQSTEGKLGVYAPFLYYVKGYIIKHAKGDILTHTGIDVPFHLTRTCYKDQEIACGTCGSCKERLKAFDRAGYVDPIEYEGV